MHLFNEDNPLVKLLCMIGNLVILNLLFLMACIPVITIGDSFCALYFSLMHGMRDESSSYVRDFFTALRVNFKKATLTWLMCLVFIFLLYGDYRIFSPQGLSPNTGLFYFFVLLGFFIFLVAEYVFPVIASFENSLTKLYSNAFAFAAGHAGWTLLIAGMWILPVAYTVWDRQLWPLYAALWFFIGFSFIAYLTSIIFLKIFSPHLPKSANEIVAEERGEHGGV